MLKFALPQGQAVEQVLCLGAHCDDIEIGCYGLLRQLQSALPQAGFHWTVFTANATRAAELRESFNELNTQTSSATLNIKDFRNGHFPYVGSQIKEYFETLKADVQPQLILTHYRNDLHQDHREISQLTWNTFRDHFILEYEIMKYDGDLGQPNFYVPLSEQEAEAKIDHLMRHYGTQQGKGWYDERTFRALLRLRGVECQAESGYAEAFYLRKMSFGV